VGPALNTTEWIALLTDLQAVFVAEGVQIPIIYGLDSVHGANYVYGATLFPQQISTAAAPTRAPSTCLAERGRGGCRRRRELQPRAGGADGCNYR
jgi:beta-glucosidase-like glycosyl hydrolase